MKLEVVAVDNWMSHQASELAPNGARFLTIRGDHGVGKTALVEAISYALFGRGRFATADEPVRIGATDMSVRVEWLSPEGQRYRVIRRRTTKAGGKGSLSFAVQRADGAWTSLDGEAGIKSTEAAIRAAVGVDGATFEAIAFLMQGRITALVEATASGRRDVLVAGLLLELWPKAATRSRKLAGDIEAAQAAARDRLERIDVALGGLPAIQADLVSARAALTGREGDVVSAQRKRDELQAGIATLDRKLADAERTVADVARLEAERSRIAIAWRTARDRENDAKAQVGRLEAVLADAGRVTAAVAELPAARAELDRLVALEADDRQLTRDIADMERAIRDLQIPYEQRAAAWRADLERATARVKELQGHMAAGAAVCATCGQPVAAKQAKAQLLIAREALVALGDQPKEPLSISTTRAGKVRLEIRQRELAWDPQGLVEARDRVSLLERHAARAEDLVRAREQLVRETAIATEAGAEKAVLAERGAAAAAEIAALQVKLAEVETFREERRRAGDAVGRAIAELEVAQASVRTLERQIAGDEARAEQLNVLEAEAAAIREASATATVEAARQRRLATVFGEIPLRIIDASLPELEAEAQGILDALDPGATVTISAQRATVDGKRIVSAIDITYTDGAGARDVRMTSGGERVAVSIALSLGLRRVLARQHGARLSTVAIDEPDGLDANQRRALALALRSLAHEGDLDRVVLITHAEDLAESGELQYVVSKNGHGSQVTQVA